MTKSKNQSLTKPSNKKKPTKQDIEKLVSSQEEKVEKPRKRLRKQNRHDSSEEDFVPEIEDDEELEDEKYEPQDPEKEDFSRFKIQNDDDIKAENQKLQQKKKSKKLKGNQQIDKFIKKQVEHPKEKSPKSKQQPQTVQTNIVDIFKKLKEKRPPTPVESESDDDESISDGELLMRRMQADQKLLEFQGNTGASQKQLIEKAMKMSLQSSEKDNKKQSDNDDDFVDLAQFQFGNLNPHHKRTNANNPHPNQASKQERKKSFDTKMQIQKSKSKQKHQDKKPQPKHEPKKPEPKSAAKKSTKKQKQPNQGPLGAQVIAFTGEFEPYNKDELIELCQKLGANCPKSLTKVTTALFQGAFVVNEWKKKTGQDVTTTGKSREAKERGIRIVPNNDLDDYFLEKTGKALHQHFMKNPTKLDGFVERQVPKESDKMEVQIADPEFVKKHKDSATFGVLWTEKYKPKTLDQVIGQGSQIKQLRAWLQDWQDVVLRGNKKDAAPVRGFLPSGTINSRAALLSGDPGLGKTTTARLLALELNYNVIEFNASDIRNKKGVQLLQTNSLGIHESSSLVKNLIIMDEVDGMSKGDRGGIAEIIQQIKNTTVPIICICNDRQSDKIRSLAGHCLDIRFPKPNKQMIVKRLHEIIKQEGGSASDLFLSRLVETFQNDMRQILNYLELAFNTKAAQLLEIKDAGHLQSFTKDSAVMLTNFQATKKLLTRYHGDFGMPLRERMECFFIDSDFVPLMVHQNYIGSMKKGKLSKEQFHKLVKANDAFVLADLIDTRIRKEQDWGLMPAFGFMSSVYPSEMVAQSVGYPQFPSWLGKFSSERKHKRLLKQLRQTIHCELPSTLKGVRYGLAEVFYQQINFLLKHEKVQQTLDMMQNYGLSPSFMNEVLLEVQYNPQKNMLLPDVTSSTKTKLTKAFNRRHEEAKMKGKAKKVAVVAPEHQKYNEVLDEMSDDDFIVNDDEEENNENSVSQMQDQKKEKNKKKPIKQGKGANNKKK